MIERLADTDVFVADLGRVLAPGGYAVVSTENLAGWHNVFALVLGWQPLSLTNVSETRLGLGNPAAGCAAARRRAGRSADRRVAT